jgi:hypothetical protein
MDKDKRRILFDGTEIDDWKPILVYTTENGERIPLAAKGDLIVVAGGKKARKSLLQTVFALSRFPNLERNRTFGFELEMEQPILYFDTEQPPRRVKRSRNRYHRTAGLTADDAGFIQYSLKGMSAPQMGEFITETIDEQVTSANPPGLIMIDQIADLLTSRDENDAASASRVIDMLNLWTDKTDALFSVSIHTNRGGEQTTGRMGSLIDKKADSTLLLTIDDSWVTHLSHVFSREERMPGISFRHDMWGLPSYIEEQINKINQI